MGFEKVEQWDTKRLEGSSGSAAAVAPVTILGALGQFIEYLRDERRASPLTLDAYERDLLRFATTLAGGSEAALASVTPEEVRDHMHALVNRGLSPATVRRALYALGSFFGWALKWELIPRNPAARVNVPPREKVREVRALSKRERALIIAAADRLASESRRPLDVQAPLLVRLMLKTGLRRAEVLDLSWRDVHFDKRELVVRHGKGNKSRRVPVEDAELLEQLAGTHGRRRIGASAKDASTLGPVIVNSRGNRLAQGSFYRLFHRVLRLAELTGCGITPHSLRHTFGSVLCDRGVPIPYVKDLLGHEDIGSTMVYVHSTPAALRAAVKKLRE